MFRLEGGISKKKSVIKFDANLAGQKGAHNVYKNHHPIQQSKINLANKLTMCDSTQQHNSTTVDFLRKSLWLLTSS